MSVTTNEMDFVPVVKDTIGTLIQEDGLVSITIPRFNKAWMAKLFLPRNKKNEIHINFDENGSKVWKQIDGQRNIGQILEQLSETASTHENYADRVILFIQGLHKNGWVQLFTLSQ